LIVGIKVFSNIKTTQGVPCYFVPVLRMCIYMQAENSGGG